MGANRVRATLEAAKEQASKIGVRTLITADELVRERKTRHETTLLEEDGCNQGTVTDLVVLNGGKNERISAKLGGVNSLPRSESVPNLEASIHYQGQVRISAKLGGVNSLPRSGALESVPNLEASIHYQGQNQRQTWRRQFTAKVRINAKLRGVNLPPRSEKIDKLQELVYAVLNGGKNEMALGFLEQWFFA
ncbi:hypothetical protein F4604DRAFT_1677050 [Suillus subluteus]|nr:hypothetical protein F4604DRAFT_1677050 [Suillus subluteus]